MKSYEQGKWEEQALEKAVKYAKLADYCTLRRFLIYLARAARLPPISDEVALVLTMEVAQKLISGVLSTFNSLLICIRDSSELLARRLCITN